MKNVGYYMPAVDNQGALPSFKAPPFLPCLQAGNTQQQPGTATKHSTYARLLVGTPFDDSLLLQKSIILERFPSPLQVWDDCAIQQLHYSPNLKYARPQVNASMEA